LKRRIINNAKAIHVASQYEKENYEALNFKTPAIIIPRGLDLSEYSSRAEYQDLRRKISGTFGKKSNTFPGKGPSEKRVGSIGRSVQKIVNARDDIFLIIAGSGDQNYVSKIKSLFKKKGLSKRVLFTGMLLSDDKLSAFHGSDVFVLPSYGENFGIAVLEAMACNLPVIITNRVGLSNDVKECGAGIVTNCGHEEIAGAIIECGSQGRPAHQQGPG